MNAEIRGNRIKFEYPDEPQFNCVLKVTKITGVEPDDFVLFEDGTHCKQKDLTKDMFVK